MRRFFQALRTAAFYVPYMGQTVILAILAGLYVALAPNPKRFAWQMASYWYKANIVLLRWIAGIKTVVEGTENIPAGPLIFASKHQSNWDVFAILPYCDDEPAFIAKRELIDIPFFGWTAKAINTIRIDRKLGMEAIPHMLRDAKAALNRGCRIIIFPEGTRKVPLADPDYRQGIVRMYEALNVPVVPVALNSGLFWGRHAVMWPGTARAKFLPAIPPGLGGREFAARLKTAIETESTKLIAQAVAAEPSRPYDAGFRARLAVVLQALGTPPADTTIG
jgi:1-acyl-sn-glycerol-3-phosphate acyltransferase